MAGERTPDLANGSGATYRSSDDDISLREHVQRQLDNIQRQLDVIIDGAQIRIGGVQKHTDTEIMHLREHFNEFLSHRKVYFENLVAELRIQLNERSQNYKEHNAEQDRRYEQRFEAQEQAVGLALARVDKEFHEHLAQVRAETHAALEAADKAITKSEASVEKRFESVNEFRAQLNDQAASFMGRSESISRHDRTAEAINELASRQETESRLQRERFNSDLFSLRDRFQSDIAVINSRLDKDQGSHLGGREAISDKRISNSAVMAAIGFGVMILLAALTVLGFVITNTQ